MTYYILGNLWDTSFYIGSPHFEDIEEMLVWYDKDIINRVDTVEITYDGPDGSIMYKHQPIKEFIREYKISKL